MMITMVGWNDLKRYFQLSQAMPRL